MSFRPGVRVGSDCNLSPKALSKVTGMVLHMMIITTIIQFVFSESIVVMMNDVMYIEGKMLLCIVFVEVQKYVRSRSRTFR